MGPVIGFFGAVIFGVGAGASLAYTLAVNIARIALLSLVSKALAPKIDLQQTAQNKSLTIKSAIAPQGFVYGQDLLSGPLLFAQVTGENNEYLHRVVALAAREIDSFVSFRFDDDDIAIGDSPLTGIAAIPGTVASGKWNGLVYIDARTGTSTQTVFSQLNTDLSTTWTSAHRGRGWAMLYTKMTLDPNNPDAFQTGAPQNLKAVVRGHKIYDPRLDSTRVIDSTTSPATTGSGTHRHNDPSTWAWSDNPALCLADWLTWEIVGLGEPDTRIDWELVAAAADKCDELVVIPPAASPSNTQKRYTCNLTFYADQERGGVKQILEEAMLGRCLFSQGQWRMWAGAAYPATFTLSEAHLAGKFQVEAGTPSKERYNRVVGKFVDPARDYQAVAYPEQLNGTWAIDDGGDKPKTFDFNACNNNYEAQRNAIIRLKQSRNQRIVVFEGNWSCFQIQPGRTVNVDFAELSWASPAEKFFVTEWTLRDDGTGVDLTLVEENDSAWADPAVGDYTIRTPTGPLVPPSKKAVKLTGTTIANEASYATVYAGVRLGADGQVYYQKADGSYSAVIAPDDEWLRSGSGYSFRALLNSGGPLDTGNVNTWEDETADRSYSVQTTSGAKGANITLQITDDASASPVSVVTQGTFQLTATKPQQTIVLQGVGATWNTSVDGVSSANVPMPSGLQTDDVVFVFVFTGGSDEDIATPTGWAEVLYDQTSHQLLCFTRVIGAPTGSDNFAMDGTYSGTAPRSYKALAFRDLSNTQFSGESLAIVQGGTFVNGPTGSTTDWQYYGISAGTQTEEHLIISVHHRADSSTPPTNVGVQDHPNGQLTTAAKHAYHDSVNNRTHWWVIAYARQNPSAQIGDLTVNNMIYNDTSTFALQQSFINRFRYS